MPPHTHDNHHGCDGFWTEQATDRVPPVPLTVDRREAARILGISERLLWSLTDAGEVPHARLGARVVYPIDELRHWLSQRVTGAKWRASTSSSTIHSKQE